MTGMTRPKSIQYFEQCYLGSFALGIIALLLTWSTQMAMLQSNPATAAMGSGALYTTMLGGFLLGAVITWVLWYFAARRASVVAKWIIVVFFGFGVLGLLAGLARGTMAPGIGGILQVANFVLQAVAVWMLFKPASNAWFGGNRNVEDVRDTFR